MPSWLLIRSSNVFSIISPANQKPAAKKNSRDLYIAFKAELLLNTKKHLIILNIAYVTILNINTFSIIPCNKAEDAVFYLMAVVAASGKEKTSVCFCFAKAGMAIPMATNIHAARVIQRVWIVAGIYFRIYSSSMEMGTFLFCKTE